MNQADETRLSEVIRAYQSNVLTAIRELEVRLMKKLCDVEKRIVEGQKNNLSMYGGKNMETIEKVYLTYLDEDGEVKHGPVDMVRYDEHGIVFRTWVNDITIPANRILKIKKRIGGDSDGKDNGEDS